jgi:Transcriptional regulators
VLRLDSVDDEPLLHWIETNRPDVIVFVHHQTEQFQGFLARHGIRVPEDIGVIAVTHFVAGTGFAGYQQNQSMMGRCAVEMVVAQLMRGEVGFPAEPHIEMVESRWVDGPSLRSVHLIGG